MKHSRRSRADALLVLASRARWRGGSPKRALGPALTRRLRPSSTTKRARLEMPMGAFTLRPRSRRSPSSLRMSQTLWPKAQSTQRKPAISTIPPRACSSATTTQTGTA
eukprot:Amastigsp_a1309_61.p8 type:complete len:108 gc:universal Amastigsp_a1309_61:2946-2623(-)